MKNGISNLTEVFTKTLQDEVTLDFDAQVLAALMLQSNALVSIKMATRLCSISRQEIDRRIHTGTFPAPLKLSGEQKSIRKAFRILDIQDWLKNPAEYVAGSSSSAGYRHNPTNKLSH